MTFLRSTEFDINRSMKVLFVAVIAKMKKKKILNKRDIVEVQYVIL